ncbi:MAG: PBP1A family penicillin-binding protein [Terriglobia bacterium]
MAKIQTLGLSDDGKKRSSDPPSPQTKPPSPPENLPESQTSATEAIAGNQSAAGHRAPETAPEAEADLTEPIDEPRQPLPDFGEGLTGATSVAETVINPEAEPEVEPEPSLLPPPPLRSSRFSLRRVIGQFFYLVLILLSAGIGALGGLVFVYSSNLPQVRQLMEYRPDVMTELYADDGTPIGSFALERRVIVTYDQIPKVLRDAVLSIEDKHFESHWGVDVIRVVRAAITDLMEWRRAQGASTLTMQLSKKLFFTPEKSFRRKFQEVLIAIQIERHFTKQQIFTLYCNQIELGHGNFGFAAAAQFYFGKRLDQLTLPEAALLAGLPRTPTGYSPLIYPERARQRRNVVLAAMLENGKISEEQFRQARAAPLNLSIQRWTNSLAPYFVEDARLFLEKKYGAEAVHEKGLRVYTTLDATLQRAAERALQDGLREYDKRHGWRGPEQNIIKDPPTLPNGLLATLETYTHPDWRKPLEVGALLHGLVTDVKSDSALVRFGELTAKVTRPDFAWTGKTSPYEAFTSGDVDLFQIKEIKGQTLHVTLDQRPQVQGALVAIENSTGAIKAMVGGYDFEESKFNRARQAERQSGSSFKVYVYAAALLDGANPFDTILDAPVSFPSASGVWSPHNYDNKFLGNITLLHALAESRNVPAVRLLSRVGVDKVIKLCRRFGITSRLVPNLPLALGASDLTLLEHTSAFTTFPDDGVHISPRMIERVTNYEGRVIDDFAPEVADVIPAPIARLETSMLREVFMTGTAVRAKSLAEKYPLAGKTGTTNDFVDAWFIGFSPSLTAGVWVGFDDHRTLGAKEEGAKAALPIWMEFMEEALKNRPAEDFAHSPLLRNPDQVKEILASAATERLLARDDTAPGAENKSASEGGTAGSPASGGGSPGSARNPSQPAAGGPSAPKPAVGQAASQPTPPRNDASPPSSAEPPKPVPPSTTSSGQAAGTQQH